MRHPDPEGSRFDDALRAAAEDPEVPDRIRSALRATWAHRDERHEPLGRAERRLWALLPAARTGRLDERAVLDLALRIVSSDGARSSRPAR